MKKILLIADAAPGLPPGSKTAAPPVPASAQLGAGLTCDTTKLLADVKAGIAALEKDAAILPPLLGFALTNLRGAANTIAGHNASVAKK